MSKYEKYKDCKIDYIREIPEIKLMRIDIMLRNIIVHPLYTSLLVITGKYPAILIAVQVAFNKVEHLVR